MTHFAYPARLQRDGKGYSVFFADVPGAFGGGDTPGEALASAEEALAEMLLDCMERGDAPPATSHAGTDDIMVPVPADTAVKLAVWQAWRDAGISKSELGRRIGKHEAEARRILDPRHRTGLKMLDQALRALGHRMEVSVRAV